MVVKPLKTRVRETSQKEKKKTLPPKKQKGKKHQKPDISTNRR